MPEGNSGTNMKPFSSYSYNLAGKPSATLFDRGEATHDCLQEIYDSHNEIYLSEFMKLDRAIPTTVYRYYDGEGLLLYVGIANEFGRRDKQHIERSTWRHLAAFVRLELFPWRYTALRIEGCAIQFENPEHNSDRKMGSKFLAITERKQFRKTKGIVSGHVGWLALEARKRPWGPWG